MAPEYDVVLSVLPKTLHLPSPSAFTNVETALFALLLSVGFTWWLTPGGLAWALARYHSRPAQKPIPGPPGLPLVGLGHVFAGRTPHRALAALARSSGAERLMGFSVGLTRFVISSHPETAREILTGPGFSDRPVKESAHGLLFRRAMGFAPHGHFWRSLRRISAAHLFGPRTVAASECVRSKIAADMAAQVRGSMSATGGVELRKILHFGSLNNITTAVFGKSYDFDGEEGSELEEMVREGYELLGMFNWSDHFPVIGWFDFQGVRRRCSALVSRVNVFVGNVIEEHRKKNRDRHDAVSDDAPDFVDVLLDLQNEEKLTDTDMIAVLWEMVFRGTDTVAILMEWVLARMVLHPDIQSKARSEIDAVVGSSRPVSDSDLPRLPYVHHIVKETLRVHPPGPLLSWARLATRDVLLRDGSLVPAGTTAMVNMWAIARDGTSWPEPERFFPERFSGGDDVSVMGGDPRLAPFGSGRRICPGKNMGLATVHLWVAQLLQSFEWVPSNAGVDLTEHLKMSMEMENPLICRAFPRVA